MNDIVRGHLHADLSFGRHILIGIFKLVALLFPIGMRLRIEKYLYYIPQSDYGLWNTNAIREFESIDSVDLHVIVPVNMTSRNLEEFNNRNIHYHIVKSHDGILHKVFGRRIKLPSYKKDRAVITSIIRSIDPDVVHIIGAENPQYSQVVFDIYKKFPVIVQLQTLLSDPHILNSDGINPQVVKMEKAILTLPIFIGTNVKEFKQVILSMINPKAKILNIRLAVSEPVERKKSEKKCDFVYFSANINKAADLAVSAFCLAAKQHPEITLKIIGAYSAEYKKKLEEELINNGVEGNVTFEGSLPTHEDVLRHIREARFALLPLRIDLISGTIREACANGLPVISTITEGTPYLNKERETALLSKIGDSASMANNMIRLIENPILAERLRENGYLYAEGFRNNRDSMYEWVEVYQTIMRTNKI
jgi:glycosyltransferase involved in cell wall biosynthesis